MSGLTLSTISPKLLCFTSLHRAITSDFFHTLVYNCLRGKKKREKKEKTQKKEASSAFMVEHLMQLETFSTDDKPRTSYDSRRSR